MGNTQRPCKNACWRYDFRFRLQKSKDTNGFMIQVEEANGLGDGQKIETEIAKEINLKVFRTYTDSDDLHVCFFRLGKAVKEWYESDCANSGDLENVFLGYGAPTRPKYERFWA